MASSDSFRFMAIVPLLIGVLVSPAPVLADAFGGSAEGFVAGCSSGHESYAVGLGVTAQASGVCNTFFPNGTGTAFSEANTFTSTELTGPQIMGVVRTDSLGVSANARATSFDTVTIRPPSGSSNAAADVLAGDIYRIDIKDANKLVLATVQGGGVVSATSSAEVFVGIRLTPLSFPTTFPIENSVTRTVDGSFSGTLLTPPVSILGCPCDFLFELHGSAGAASGASAEFHDGPFLILPSGWTYSFASSVPEPASVVLLMSGLSVFGIAISRRRREFGVRVATRSGIRAAVRRASAPRRRWCVRSP